MREDVVLVSRKVDAFDLCSSLPFSPPAHHRDSLRCRQPVETLNSPLVSISMLEDSFNASRTLSTSPDSAALKREVTMKCGESARQKSSRSAI